MVLYCRWSQNKGSVLHKLELWDQNRWSYNQGGLKIKGCKIERPLYVFLQNTFYKLLILDCAFRNVPVLLQIELDKTAEEFRKVHMDRQELIAQWEQTIEQMQKRDKEMDLLAAVGQNQVGH